MIIFLNPWLIVRGFYFNDMKLNNQRVKKIKLIALCLSFLFGFGFLVALIALIWGGGGFAAKSMTTFLVLILVSNLFKNM